MLFSICFIFKIKRGFFLIRARSFSRSALVSSEAVRSCFAPQLLWRHNLRSPFSKGALIADLFERGLSPTELFEALLRRTRSFGVKKERILRSGSTPAHPMENHVIPTTQGTACKPCSIYSCSECACCLKTLRFWKTYALYGNKKRMKYAFHPSV